MANAVGFDADFASMAYVQFFKIHSTAGVPIYLTATLWLPAYLQKKKKNVAIWAMLLNARLQAGYPRVPK